MIRIEIDTRGDETVLEVHGRLAADAVPALARACAGLPRPFTLDLANLQGADEDGVRALRAERGRGTRFRGTSPYVALLLDGSCPPPRAR